MKTSQNYPILSVSHQPLSQFIQGAVRSNVFRVTVTGQVVEDFNGNGKIEEKEVLAEKKITTVYDRGRKHRKFLSWKIE